MSRDLNRLFEANGITLRTPDVPPRPGPGRKSPGWSQDDVDHDRDAEALTFVVLVAIMVALATIS